LAHQLGVAATLRFARFTIHDTAMAAMSGTAMSGSWSGTTTAAGTRRLPARATTIRARLGHSELTSFRFPALLKAFLKALLKGLLNWTSQG